MFDIWILPEKSKRIHQLQTEKRLLSKESKSTTRYDFQAYFHTWCNSFHTIRTGLDHCISCSSLSNSPILSWKLISTHFLEIPDKYWSSKRKTVASNYDKMVFVFAPPFITCLWTASQIWLYPATVSTHIERLYPPLEKYNRLFNWTWLPINGWCKLSIASWLWKVCMSNWWWDAYKGTI